MKRKGLIVAGCVLTVLALGSLFLVAFYHGHRNAAIQMCANNLNQLQKMQGIYSRSHGPCSSTGRDYWRALTRTMPPLIDDSSREGFLKCPVVGSGGAEIHYWGPAVDAALLASDAPLGCDDPSNHGDGGNVVRKSGSVAEITDAAWKDFLVSRRCIP